MRIRRAASSWRRDLIGRFNVKAGGPDAAAQSLSGGNLQKFIVGREIDANPKLLIVSQPTWGVDVGAAAQIRGELLALRDAGCAVLVVSEELDELFEISDRLVVIAKGRLSPSVPTARGDGRADRRVDERACGHARRSRCPASKEASRMLRLEARPQPSTAGCRSPRRCWRCAITVLIGVVLFALLGKDPVRGLQVFFLEPIKSAYALGELAVKATPLLLIALGLAVCFRSNVWNIGAEGQFVIGAMVAGGVAHAGRQGHRRAGSSLADPARRRASAAWSGPASSRCCATASTPTRSWSA